MDLRGIKELLKDTIKYILLVIAVLITFLYVVSFQQVIGPSMEPNYKEGEIFLLNKIRYRFMDFKRFDVVVLNNKKSKYMIKRIIGLPGESIEYKEDVLYVDGVKVEENFSRNGETVDYDVVKMLNQRIPNDHYFVVGDNRVNSEDSRIFGFVSKQDIIGKVEFRIWPLFK